MEYPQTEADKLIEMWSFRVNVAALKNTYRRSPSEFWHLVNRIPPSDVIWQACVELEAELDNEKREQ